MGSHTQAHGRLAKGDVALFRKMVQELRDRNITLGDIVRQAGLSSLGSRGRVIQIMANALKPKGRPTKPMFDGVKALYALKVPVAKEASIEKAIAVHAEAVTEMLPPRIMAVWEDAIVNLSNIVETFRAVEHTIHSDPNISKHLKKQILNMLHKRRIILEEFLRVQMYQR